MMYEGFEETKRDSKRMYVCKHCLMAIESREGSQRARKIYIDDEENETESRCDWCEEYGFDTLYEI